MNYRDQIKIVFFDIDDTLYLKKQDTIPDSVQPALRQLKANGIIPAIATGRTRCAFPAKIEKIICEENIDVIVTMNGQYVTYQNEVLKKFPLNPQDLTRMITFFEANNIEYALITADRVLVSEVNEHVRFALDPITTNYTTIQDPDFILHNDIFQILAFYDEEKERFVQNAGIFQHVRTVRWHENSVDIFDEKGSKARGIQAVLQRLNLSMDQAMAFGDGLNDLEMLSSVGVGVAMGNGHDELKKVANYVTDSVAEHGIANFLHKAGLTNA
ncbi:Cof-type HAD-IIB family hydrolase [Conservatibacter flavescens]|uniref:Cof-type HAD-IIB family hydrolase n=1 Tax=Conservatibacter flavescens TaxID=28161 RepID=A0A2M8RZM6_9PAST|nr:Cof-type HAD-IIB family hydrolase [Conservatibacter flavescens]PJG84324.1 Cof-type HAD-IIB family hydrolase [Conservatibacter flavescens]